MAKLADLGFGTYRLHGEEAYTGTLHALKSGYDLIDSAPLYGNQSFVGKAIKDSGRSRGSFRVTTKVSRDTLINPDPNAMTESFFNTLKELNLDYVDELILHEPIDFMRNWKRLCDLYQNEGKGKIGRIGVSNFDKETLRQIIQDGSMIPSVNQIEINPFLTRGDLPSFCRDHGIDVVAHSPLAKGEKMSDEFLNRIATKYNVSCAQMMLRWGIEHGFRVIPRSKDKVHIEENMGIRFEIDPEDLQRMRDLDCGYATHPKYLKKGEYVVAKKPKQKQPKANS
jgi:diketogulonate reductase-like aldo/keto reductase